MDFHHPLLRTLIARRTPPSVRLRVSQALVAVSEGDPRVWYRAAATAGPDEEVAAALADIAIRTRRRGGCGASAHAWHRAAELTPDQTTRVRRLLEAAVDAHLGGLSHDAARWSDEAARVTDDPVARADIALIRGRILTGSGHPTRAYDHLVQAAEDVVHVDAGRAGLLLAEAVTPAIMTGAVTAAVRDARRSQLLTGPPAATTPSTAPTAMSSRAAVPHRARAFSLAGKVREARACLDAARVVLASADAVDTQQALALTGQTYADMEDDDVAGRLLTTVVDAARRAGAPGILAYALTARCGLEGWRGRWAVGYADGVAALRWAEELGQIGVLGFSLVALARIDAARGDRAVCEERINRIRSEIGPYGITSLSAYADSVLGLAALGYGEYDVAVVSLQEAWSTVCGMGLGNPTVIPLAGDLAEAHLHVGDHDRALEVVAWLEERAAATGLAWPAAVAARCRGLTAEDLPTADAAFAAAETAHHRRNTPFEHARTQLAQGKVMRRLRRPAAARMPLRAAYTTFTELGARPWARQAVTELTATGDRSLSSARSASTSSPLDHLTPTELHVARAIATGMNNIEAAATLFVSRKTVEAHLTRIYRKLGIRYRSELARTLIVHGIDDTPPQGS
jgi:DNA-binding CsgD family transcriptional regulator